MSLYPEDDPVKKINEEYKEHEKSKTVSNVDPTLNVHHELPQEKEARERQEKEEKAKALVEGMQAELKQYIDTQMQAIPQLINQNIQAGFEQIIPQLQGSQQPQGQPAQGEDKIAAIAQLAPVLQGLLGKTEAPPQNNIFQDMIMQSFVKMIQAKVDETVMGTYGVRVPPPQDIINPQTRQAPRVDIE